MVESDVSDVRGKMPSFAPFFLTHLTGKALAGQTPLYRSTFQTQLLWALSLFATAIWGSTHLIASYSSHPSGLRLIAVAIGLPIYWLLMVSGARYLVVVIHHQCVHGNFSGSKFWDRAVGELSSLITFTQDFSGYQSDHIADHHSKKLATLRDPDFQFLRELGFRPGMPVDMLWRHLYWTIFSPKFHMKFIWLRVRSNFLTAPIYRRVISVGFWVGLLTLVQLKHCWGTFLLAYVLPITLFYHASSLLQFLCEHQWARVKLPGEAEKLHFVRLTNGRFCGEPAPTRGLSLANATAARSRWILRMLFIHLPARLFVLVGDLPVHDHHHRKPMEPDWGDAIYARQRQADLGFPGWPEPATEIWGLGNAINRLFKFWASLPEMPNDQQADKTPPDEVFVPYPPTLGVIDKSHAEGLNAMYKDSDHKFVAVLNGKIQLPQLMNALAHCSAGLSSIVREPRLQMLDYIDASEGVHPGISRFPWIILQAKNSNQLRELRNKAKTAGLEITDFVRTMLGESADQQMAATRAAYEPDLDYFAVCLYGEAAIVEPLTKKFSLFRTANSEPALAQVAWG